MLLPVVFYVPFGPLFIAEKSHKLTVEYINADDDIFFFLDLINKMRWVLIIFEFPLLYSQYNRNNRLTQLMSALWPSITAKTLLFSPSHHRHQHHRQHHQHQTCHHHHHHLHLHQHHHRYHQ